MNLDLLDESYPMVKYILHFEQVDQTSRTGLGRRFDRFHQLCQFWSSTRGRRAMAGRGGSGDGGEGSGWTSERWVRRLARRVGA